MDKIYNPSSVNSCEFLLSHLYFLNGEERKLNLIKVVWDDDKYGPQETFDVEIIDKSSLSLFLCSFYGGIDDFNKALSLYERLAVCANNCFSPEKER